MRILRYLGSLRHRWGLFAVSMIFSLVMNSYALIERGRWEALWWAIPSVGCAILGVLAIRVRATWFQTLAIAWTVAVTSFFNLFMAIGS